MIRSIPLLTTSLVLVLAASGCSSSQSIVAGSSSAAVTVDGSEAEWGGTLNPVVKQPGLAIGARAGADALYVVAVLRNQRQVRQALGRGLTLWLNASGGKDRALGVRFPLGAEAGSGPPTGDGRMTDALRQRFAAATVDLEVLHDGADEGVRLSAAGASGIGAAATLEGDILIVEYKIPLGDGAFGLSNTTSGTIGLGLTTERRQPVGVFGDTMDASERAEARSNRSGPGRRQGQGAGDASAGGQAAEFNTLEVWLTIRLPTSD